MNWDQSKYPPQDTDARVFLQQFDSSHLNPPGVRYQDFPVVCQPDDRPVRILAVGSNEEDTANVLTDSGFEVSSYDLRLPVLSHMQLPRHHWRCVGDFVEARHFPAEHFDHAYSLSAIEHFGFSCYEGSPTDLDYDVKAMDRMWGLLKWGGCCWITVPYGRVPTLFYPQWRIYDQNLLLSRIVRKFSVETMLFFKSNPDCPGQKEFPKDADGIEWVPRNEADAWKAPPTHPHQTVFLKMRKDR